MPGKQLLQQQEHGDGLRGGLEEADWTALPCGASEVVSVELLFRGEPTECLAGFKGAEWGGEGEDVGREDWWRRHCRPVEPACEYPASSTLRRMNNINNCSSIYIGYPAIWCNREH